MKEYSADGISCERNSKEANVFGQKNMWRGVRCKKIGKEEKGQITRGFKSQERILYLILEKLGSH